MSTLSFFWSLASADEAERISSAALLIRSISAFPPEGSDDENSEKWTAGLGPDAVYAVRRLVRGLASPRESSRLGFAVALTGILRAAVGIDPQSILDLIIASSDDSAVSKQEVKDTLFARLFGISVMFNSGLAFASLDIYKQSIIAVLHCGQTKKWLAEAACWVVLQSFTGARQKAWGSEASEWFVSDVLKGMDWSPEKIGFIVNLQPLMPDYDWKLIINPALPSETILHVSNLPLIAKIMREISIDSTTSAGTGSWRPKLHWTWTMLLEHFQKDSFSFATFWQIVVDDSLFASSATSERKMWGFMVAAQALPNLSVSDVAVIFTPGFVRTLINHLKSPDRSLHLAARQMAEAIQTKAASDSNLGMILLSQLLGKNGSPEFDKITRTKTVADILSTLSPSGVVQYIEYLKNVFLTMADRRSWVLQQFLALFRNTSIPRHDDWISSCLEFLASYGYVFNKKSKASVPVSKVDPIRVQCRSMLVSIVSELGKVLTLPTKSDDVTLIKKSSPFESFSGQNWLEKVFLQVDKLRSEKHHEYLLSEPESDRNIQQEMKTLIKSLKAEGNNTSYQKSIMSLCLSLWTQAIESDEDCRRYLEDLLTLAPTLFACIQKSFENPQQPAPPVLKDSIESLIQIILASLTKPSALIRSASTQAFGIYSGKLSSENLDTIIAQLLQTKDEDDLEEEDKTEDQPQEDINEPESEDEFDSSVSDDENDSSLEEVDPELRKKLAVALGLKLTGDANLSIDNEDMQNEEEQVSDADDDLSDMNDEQMMALDDHLGLIFKSQTKMSKKKAREAEKIAAMHTSNRVMDLIEIFAKTQSENALIIRIFIPLLSVIASSPVSESQLASRANSLLRNKVTRSKSFPTKLPLDECKEILQEIHAAARQAPNSDFDTTCSACSLQISRLILQADPLSSDFIVQQYTESHEDFVTRKSSRLQPMFFLQFIRRYPLLAWKLRSKMISADALLPYRQAQSFNMIQEILNQNKLLVKEEGLAQEMIQFMIEIRKSGYFSLLDTCQQMSEENKTSKTSRMKDLIKFVIFCARLTLKLLEEQDMDMDTVWDFAATDALVVTIKHHQVLKHLSSVQALVHQLQTTILDGGKKSKSSKKSSNEPVNNKKRKLETAPDKNKLKKAKQAK